MWLKQLGKSFTISGQVRDITPKAKVPEILYGTIIQTVPAIGRNFKQNDSVYCGRDPQWLKQLYPYSCHSLRGDLWPLNHFIRVMRGQTLRQGEKRHDLTKTKTKTKTKTHLENTFIWLPYAFVTKGWRLVPWQLHVQLLSFQTVEILSSWQ